MAILIHNFSDSLAKGESLDDEALWDSFYRKAFPNLTNHMRCPGDNVGQRLGIDRVVQLSSGQSLKIQEKMRDEDYGDILLEYISNDKTGAPGWMNQELQIDYLAYAIRPTRRCFLFPWPLLRRVWLHYGRYWVDKYPTKRAANPGYYTLSVAVPTDVLQIALRRACVIEAA